MEFRKYALWIETQIENLKDVIATRSSKIGDAEEQSSPAAQISDYFRAIGTLEVNL